MFIRPFNYSRQRLRKEINAPEIFIDVIIKDIMSGRLKKIIKLKRKKKARTRHPHIYAGSRRGSGGKARAASPPSRASVP
jgi:hypothetical protein